MNVHNSAMPKANAATSHSGDTPAGHWATPMAMQAATIGSQIVHTICGVMCVNFSKKSDLKRRTGS